MGSNSKEIEVPLEVEKVDDSYLSALLLCFSNVLPAVLNAAIDMNLFDVIAKAKSCCDDASFSASQIASLIPNEHPQLANRLERMLPLLASYSLLHCSIRSNEDGYLLPKLVKFRPNFCNFILGPYCAEKNSHRHFRMLFAPKQGSTSINESQKEDTGKKSQDILFSENRFCSLSVWDLLRLTPWVFYSEIFTRHSSLCLLSFG
ncbi:hypothetical protein PHAVU_003G006200 [Phaseolus vulgaris]|uniref:O-methyltransferase dimerisation domain-containing protein n=1 Tax=Phaseolus vulgaris TaxID=3885 RepID=V7C732_PHAVU|nr:hypothetical protein PHAVU_003G006200g [Phaseolus vulgaris]ESW25085.1 hypothetical protein PHAVU_003G006200g [Phaseolus vulgaris]